MESNNMKRLLCFLLCIAIAGLFSCTNKNKTESTKTEIPNSNEWLFPVEKNGKWGYIDKTGKIAITPQFAMVVGNFEKGQEFTPVEYYVLWGFLGRKLGHIDRSGKLLNKNLYKINERNLQQPWRVAEGMAGIQIDGKWGFIDKTGEIIIKPQFDDARQFSEGLACVNFGATRNKEGILVGGKWGYIDKSGSIIIELQYEDVYSFSEGLAAVMINGKWGYIDKKGKIVIKPQFGSVYSFSEGLASVNIERFWLGKFGYIDKMGEYVIKPEFSVAYEFSEGLAAIKIGNWESGKYGYIDKNGNIVIKPHFLAAGQFSEGLAAVYIEPFKYGFIDRTGKMIIDGNYRNAEKFINGVAQIDIESMGRVYGNPKIGYIDKTGNYVWKPSK
jgi:hypothetical protein